MLGCTFIFEEYAKKLKEKAAGYSSENLEVLLDSAGHVLT